MIYIYIYIMHTLITTGHHRGQHLPLVHLGLRARPPGGRAINLYIYIYIYTYIYIYIYICIGR